MEDIIDIIVTETTNTIEITSQASDELIDVNIIDNREDITLNVTPTLVEININSLTGNFGVEWGDITGTLADQTDLNTALGLKADLVDGKVPSSQLPSYVDDIIEVATYSALPATGETGKIYVVLDTNLIYRWSGSAYIEIKDSSAVWGAITGTLSSQTDLQNALNAKVPYTGATGNVNLGEYGATVGYLGFDTTPSGTPTGIGTMYWDSANRTVSLIDGDGDTSLQLGQEERVLVHNNTGSTLTDGQVVYVTGSTGELPSVALAVNTSDSTSSVTFGIVTESIAHGADGFITTSGIVHGLNTNAFTEGSALWLGSTAGTFTETKPVAPAHAVLVGYVIKKSGGNGSIFVKIQNGYELDELHDVLITSKANNDGLFYESSSGLWKNKSIATVLGYTPANGANYLPLTGGTLTGTLNGTNITITNSLIAKGGTFNGGASYGGIVTIDGLGSDLLMNRADTSNGSSITLLTNAVEKWNIGLRSAGATDNFFIYNSNLTANSLTINSSNSAATFASSVTANSFVKTSGTSSQFLKADGSVDSSVYLTTGTASSTYLPLSGGTLTGALSGTSATFSGAVELGGTQLVRWGLDDGSANARTWGIRNGYNASGDFVVLSSSTNNTTLNTVQLQIARSGAATFSSSVTAAIGYFGSSTTIGFGGVKLFVKSSTALDYEGLVVQSSSNSDSVTIAHTGTLGRIATTYGTGGTGTFTDLAFATSGTDRLYITSAGNVGIGTTAPSYLLHLVPPSTSSDANNTNTGSTANLYNYFVRQKGASNGISGIQYMLQTFSDAGANGMEIYTQGASSTLVFGTAATERMRITSGGMVGIGTTSATYGEIFKVVNTGASANTAFFYFDGSQDRASIISTHGGSTGTTYRNHVEWKNSSGSSVGSVAVNGTTTLYNTTSDYRLKEDLKPINGLEIVNKIKVYDYKWKASDSRMDGVLAHELAEVLPYAVNGVKDGEQMQGVDYSKIVPVMVQAIKDLKAKIETLENK